MNWEQLSTIVRHTLTFFGGIAVAKGWVSSENLPQIVGAIITIGGFGWGLFNKTQKQIVASAAAIPNTVVVTTPELAASVPSRDAMSNADVRIVTTGTGGTTAPGTGT